MVEEDILSPRPEDPDNGCNEFTSGIPNGHCMSDGHFMCKNCKHYRKDFFDGGVEYIDYFFTRPMVYITTL